MGTFLFGIITGFLGMRAVCSLPKFWSKLKKKFNLKGFFRSKRVRDLLIWVLVAVAALMVFSGFNGSAIEQLFRLFVSSGSFLGAVVGLLAYGKQMTQSPDEEGKTIPGQQGKTSGSTSSQNNAYQAYKESFDTAGTGNTQNDRYIRKIREMRISIQEEIKKKEAEARRMMSDPYLREESKGEILQRYADCIKLLQELYAEASNVLAYLETNGADFNFDMDSLYVSEEKVNDLQYQLDKLKAYRKLDTGKDLDNLDDLMAKYDADFEKLKDEGQNQGQVQTQGRMR